MLEVVGFVLGGSFVICVAALLVARFMRVGAGPQLGPCACGCARTVTPGWDGMHGR